MMMCLMCDVSDNSFRLPAACQVLYIPHTHVEAIRRESSSTQTTRSIFRLYAAGALE